MCLPLPCRPDRYLRLSYNQVEGTLPSSLGALTNLRYGCCCVFAFISVFVFMFVFMFVFVRVRGCVLCGVALPWETHINQHR